MRHPPHLWPLLAGRALLAFAFGVLALAWPGITLYALVVLFGAWALVDGVSRLVTTIRAGADNDRRWPEVLGGLAGIAVGVLTLVWPAVTALALTVLIAVWAIMIGVAETLAAIRWRRVLTGEWRLVLAGVLTFVLGVVLLLAPVPGALGLSQVMGAFAVVYAGLLGALAMRVYRWEKDHPVVVMGGPHAAPG
ncbi:MAG: HdeD family acid-resistance protein [Frankiales bacterium]|jgi:uncharacterized membrane protein HdeD (DUF308 family)|nr:HdeD family acid-resistance protein [Frankiales bacterium]